MWLITDISMLDFRTTWLHSHKEVPFPSSVFHEFLLGWPLAELQSRFSMSRSRISPIHSLELESSSGTLQMPRVSLSKKGQTKPIPIKVPCLKVESDLSHLRQGMSYLMKPGLVGLFCQLNTYWFTWEEKNWTEKNPSIRLPCRLICVVFSWLRLDVGGSRPLPTQSR